MNKYILYKTKIFYNINRNNKMGLSFKKKNIQKKKGLSGKIFIKKNKSKIIL